MRIHKRILTLICPAHYLKKITAVNIDPGVNVELKLSEVE